MRLAIVASHQIQYQAPLFRELAKTIDLVVFFGHRASQVDQARAGFGVGFNWDNDLSSGYTHHFLENVAIKPDLEHFSGCDTPAVMALLKEGKFDAVLVMGWHLKCYWQAIWAAKRLGLPVLVRGDSHLHTPRSRAKKLVKNFLYPPALRVFNAALYVGEYSRRYWEYYRYPANRLFFSPHCVDNKWFAEKATTDAREQFRASHDIPPDAKVLLFAGKLVPIKRPLDLVNAAAQLRPRSGNVIVLVAGDGVLAGDMSAAARASEVKLVHLGFRNQSQMPAVYASADVMVLPSSEETWGLVANESLACGTPIVVSSGCGCAPDLVADKAVGRIAQVGDTHSLAEAIADILAKRPSASAIALRTRRYSLETAANGIGHALASVASRS